MLFGGGAGHVPFQNHGFAPPPNKTKKERNSAYTPAHTESKGSSRYISRNNTKLMTLAT